MDNSKILEELFENDFATRELNLPGTIKIIVRTIDVESQESLEEALANLRDADITNRQFLQAYALELAARTLVSWGKFKPKEDVESAKEFLRKKSVNFIDKIVKEQTQLEKDVRAALNIEDIDKTFFPEEKAPQEQH